MLISNSVTPPPPLEFQETTCRSGVELGQYGPPCVSSVSRAPQYVQPILDQLTALCAAIPDDAGMATTGKSGNISVVNHAGAGIGLVLTLAIGYAARRNERVKQALVVAG